MALVRSHPQLEDCAMVTMGLLVFNWFLRSSIQRVSDALGELINFSSQGNKSAHLSGNYSKEFCLFLLSDLLQWLSHYDSMHGAAQPWWRSLPIRISDIVLMAHWYTEQILSQLRSNYFSGRFNNGYWLALKSLTGLSRRHQQLRLSFAGTSRGLLTIIHISCIKWQGELTKGKRRFLRDLVGKSYGPWAFPYIEIVTKIKCHSHLLEHQ